MRSCILTLTFAAVINILGPENVLFFSSHDGNSIGI